MALSGGFILPEVPCELFFILFMYFLTTDVSDSCLGDVGGTKEEGSVPE